MVPPIPAPLLPFSPHTKTSLKPSAGTTIPHRGCDSHLPRPASHVETHAGICFPAVPFRFVWQCRLPDHSSHHTVASVLFLSCTCAPCQGPQLCRLLHCCCTCSAHCGMPASVPEAASPSKAEPCRYQDNAFFLHLLSSFLSWGCWECFLSCHPLLPTILRAHIKSSLRTYTKSTALGGGETLPTTTAWPVPLSSDA